MVFCPTFIHPHHTTRLIPSTLFNHTHHTTRIRPRRTPSTPTYPYPPIHTLLHPLHPRTFYTPDYEAWIEVINSNSQSRRRGISQAGRDILEISMGINQGPAALAALSAADLAAALPPPPPPAEEGEGGEEKEERSTSTDKRKSKKRVGGLAALARAKTPNAKNAQGFETQPMTVAPAGAPSEPASDPPAQDAPPAFDDFMGD